MRVAVAQYAPVIGDREANRRAAVERITAAREAGVDVLVLPELASSGYVFADDDEAAALAEPLDGAFTTALADACHGSALTVAAGLAERREDGRRHNTAVLVSADGVLGAYRKLHLFHDEQSWFVPGDELPVVDLPVGRVGMVVCFDLWFPEACRALALAGAEMILVPTNWVASFKRTVRDAHGYIQGDIMAMARAAENGVVVACADRTGEERGSHFLGSSIIVAADGWPVAGPASEAEDELLVADVDLTAVARAQRRTPRNHLLGDRRADYTPVAVPRPAATARP